MTDEEIKSAYDARGPMTRPEFMRMHGLSPYALDRALGWRSKPKGGEKKATKLAPKATTEAAAKPAPKPAAKPASKPADEASELENLRQENKEMRIALNYLDVLLHSMSTRVADLVRPVAGDTKRQP
jgi:hypothetical protein